MITLCPHDANKPLWFLHLRSGTIKALLKAGVCRIGPFALSPTALKRFPGLRQAGRCDIEKALNSLSLSVRDGKVDWVKYARHFGLPIFPACLKTWTPSQVIGLLPDVAISVIRIRHGNNAVRVLKKQLIGPAAGRESLVQTGRRLGVTRERPRQIQQAAIGTLQRIIGRTDYSSCAFYIRPQFLLQLRAIVRHIRGLSRPLPYSKWVSYLQRKWSVAPENIAAAERLLLEICGLNLLTFPGNILRPLICREARRKTLLLNIAAHAATLLRTKHPDGLQERDLQEALRKELKTKLDHNEVRAVIQSLIGVTSNRGFYRAETTTLRHAVDRFERVLKESAKPLHYREIIERANRKDSKMQYGERSAVTHLTRDTRFVPAGGRGCWALAKWNPETRTIAQVCVDEIKKSGRPLNEDYLYRVILKSRPIKFSSIRRLLSTTSEVRRVGRKLWGLKGTQP